MKKILLILFTLFCFIPNMFGEETNSLQMANDYYDKDNYSLAEQYFRKAISEGNESGLIFYRFAFTLENTHSDDSLMKECYKASVFCFERDSEMSNKYYEKANSKLDQFHLDRNNLAESLKTINNIVSGKKAPINFSFSNIVTNLAEYLLGLNKNTKTILIIIAILIYILAWFLSMGTNCTIVFTWWDMILLLISGSIFCYNLYTIHSGDKAEGSFVIAGIFIISLAISFIISFIANLGNPLPLAIIYTIVSIVTKLVLILIVPIIVFMALESFRSGKKDKRYKDGTKNNEKTFVVTLVFLFIGLLVSPLVKTSKNSKVSKTIDNLTDDRFTGRFIQRWNSILGD